MSGFVFFFFFNDTATTEIYTLSLHDALPISIESYHFFMEVFLIRLLQFMLSISLLVLLHEGGHFFFSKLLDRKSTRLNSSHANISYAVFCLKKKKNTA